MGKNLLICFDRDGTIIYDNKYHLGRQKNWKKLIKFRKNIISGLKLINKKLPDAKIYLITNQSGITIKEFPLLTNEKSKEVCRYIVNLIKNRGIKIEGCFVCQHSTSSYVKSHPQFTFEKKAVCSCECGKPKIGMIKQALSNEKWNIKNTKIYVVGDRESDVKTAHNTKGFGILVPFSGMPNEKEKVLKLKSKKAFVAKNFLDAVNFINKKEIQ